VTTLPYTPIDCDFHDELESASTLGKPVTIVVVNKSGLEETLIDIITDLGHGIDSDGRGEFMTLKSGQRFRFDRIVSIDGKKRPV
jgi:Rho-binding antiterminator